MPNNYILTSEGSFISEDELYHYGVKGQKWGHRKDVRQGSSAYDSTNKRWIREPEGGSLKKQMAVLNAEKRVKSARGRLQRKAAKAVLKSAKKDLKTGYKEYRTFEKDMAKKYGKSKDYTFDSDKKNYINKRTKRTIKKFEYEGLMNYETFKRTKRIQIANEAAAAAAAMTVTAAMTLSNLYNYNR